MKIIHKISAFIIAIVISGILPVGMALADNIVNNLDITIDPAPESTTVMAGESVSVGYFISPTTGGSDVAGCNVDTSNQAILTITPPSGVTVNNFSSATLTFANCGPAQSVVYKSNIPATYNITAGHYSMSGGKSGSKWNIPTAAFTLQVNAPSDVTPPVIVPTVTPTPNPAGWNNTEVTVTWDVSDAESAVTSSSGCDEVTLTDETNSTVVTCAATSAGGTDSQSITVKIDKTKPVITGTPSPLANLAGWNNTDVAVSFICAETGAVQSGIVTNTVADETLATEGAGQSATNMGSCVDAAGNIADSATVSGINIDKTIPVITVTTPADGGAYIFNQTVLADWSATDGLSGIDSAIGTIAQGNSIDTSSVGTKSFTVTATDLAGNTTSTTVSYKVIYNFGGFLSPLGPGPKVFKAGSTIPVKFKLTDANGNSVGSVVASASLLGTSVATGCRYDDTDEQYICNLKLPKEFFGSYTIQVGLDDNTTYTKNITVK